MDERNFTYMFYGFLAAWLILVAYVVLLVLREKKIEREMESLKRMVEDRGHKS
ncbi:MAG: CcmD family protein [Bryobacteraceae bacterium]|nr:CcmD family protein [Bryobacterales bacterium]MEB2361997.1 CcmD family protein [Bryobacterales bacterium]NUN01978.1 CcmD family protein [Bryobacteraceae bacterium]